MTTIEAAAGRNDPNRLGHDRESPYRQHTLGHAAGGPHRLRLLLKELPLTRGSSNEETMFGSAVRIVCSTSAPPKLRSAIKIGRAHV